MFIETALPGVVRSSAVSLAKEAPAYSSGLDKLTSVIVGEGQYLVFARFEGSDDGISDGPGLFLLDVPELGLFGCPIDQ